MSDQEDVKLARAWLRRRGRAADRRQGRPRGSDVESMMDKRLDPEARVFLQTLGRDARAMAKGAAGARHPHASRRRRHRSHRQSHRQRSTIDINELWRRRQERNRAQRLEELGRKNAAAWSEQAEMVRGMGAGGDWRGER